MRLSTEQSSPSSKNIVLQGGRIESGSFECYNHTTVWTTVYTCGVQFDFIAMFPHIAYEEEIQAGLELNDGSPVLLEEPETCLP